MKKVLIVATSWYLALWSLFAGHNTQQALEQTKLKCEYEDWQWTKLSLKKYAKALMQSTYPHWNSSEFKALNKLWGKESAWNPEADNPESTAFGIPQMLNMSPLTPAPLQIERGLAYIEHRYGKPSIAWSHWRNNGWY